MERQPAPDFTNAFLLTMAPLVFIALTVVWIFAGLMAAMGVSYAADKGITRIARRRERS